jgi:hypothetical protein
MFTCFSCLQSDHADARGMRRPHRCTCQAYKGLDDEGGTTSPQRTQLLASRFKYKRVMLKISGEALEGDQQFGIDPAVLQRIAREVAEVSRSGVEVAIVVGGMLLFHNDGNDGVPEPFECCSLYTKLPRPTNRSRAPKNDAVVLQ